MATTQTRNRINGKATGNGHAPAPRAESTGEREWYRDLLPGKWAHLSTVTVGEVTIAPEAAEKILAHRNNGNRPLKDCQILRLSSSIAAGEFLLTGETIIFDADGNLRNGQHRLRSVVDAGKAIRTLVVVGVEKDTFRLLDQHSRRMLADILGMRGEEQARILAGAIPNLQGFLRTGAAVKLSGKPASSTTLDTTLRVVDDHPGLRDSANLIAANQKQTRLFAGASKAAAWHYIFSRVDKAKADAFFGAVLSKEIPEGEHWSGARMLLNRLVENMTARKKMTASDIASCTIKAWNAVYEGRLIVNLRSNAKHEDFPKVAGLTYNGNIPVL